MSGTSRMPKPLASIGSREVSLNGKKKHIQYQNNISFGENIS
jgi:hypothetical protein